MPLPPPTAREPIHTRRVTCNGYRRADGLWDIEGHLVDTKSYGFSNQDRGEVAPGEPIHEMWLRLTLDDTLTIRAVEAVTDHSPFRICPNITPNFQRLVGLQIKSGFTQAVRERVGGVHGCTHLVELTGPVATTAFQTVFPYLARMRAKPEGREDGPPQAEEGDKAKRPLLLNTCHAFASDGPVVKRQWPQFYTGSR